MGARMSVDWEKEPFSCHHFDMRNLSRLLFSAAAIGAIGVWVACGGSDDQDVVQSDAGSDTGSSQQDTGTSNNDSGGQKDTGTPDTSPPKGYCDLNDCDAGAPNLIESGTIDGGIACVVGGEGEEEPNDTALLANEMKPTRCGVIIADGGPDAGEDDYFKFTLNDASTSFYVQYAGKVHVYVQADGSAPVDITQPGANLPFVYNQPYFVKVRTADDKQQVYRVTLFETK